MCSYSGVLRSWSMGKTILESSTASLMGIVILRLFPGTVPDADEPSLYHCTHWFVRSQNNFCHLIQNTCLASFIFMDFDFLCWIAEPLRLKIASDDHRAEYFYFIMKYFCFSMTYPGKNICFPHSPPDIQHFFTVSKTNFSLSVVLIQGSGAFSLLFFSFVCEKRWDVS